MWRRLARELICGAVCLVGVTLLTQGALGQAALDMAGAQAEAEGWKRQLSDDFNRTELSGVLSARLGKEASGYCFGPIAERSGTGRIQSCDAKIAIGRIQDALGRFDGRIQEARISNVARDAGWIGTLYRNISSPRSFLRIAEEGLA